MGNENIIFSHVSSSIFTFICINIGVFDSETHDNCRYHAINITAANKLLQKRKKDLQTITKIKDIPHYHLSLMDRAGLTGYGKNEYEAIKCLFRHKALFDS